MQAIGITQDGGFAEYSVIPTSQGILMDKDLALLQEYIGLHYGVAADRWVHAAHWLMCATALAV